MQIDPEGPSPGVWERVTYAGVTAVSFAEAALWLERLAGLVVSAKQVERWTEQVGAERVAQRQAEVQAWQAKPLMEKVTPPTEPPGEDLVAVASLDGGRLQLRNAGSDACPKDESSPPAKSRHWREDKIGLLMTMRSAVQAEDPCPEVPATFVDPSRVLCLVEGLKRRQAEREPLAASAVEPVACAAAGTEAAAGRRPGAPEVQERMVLASRQDYEAFGPMLATAAWRRGWIGAVRKAFVADGGSGIWTVWRRWFSSWTPILDFVHVLSYVYAAAVAGRTSVEGWAVYVVWITAVWQGRVREVIAALRQRQAELGPATAADTDGSPRRIVQAGLQYLENHQDWMRYDEYRRQGLPLMSSYVESTVKQVNRRLKGTEKFWTEAGAEAVLQLRADYLSDGDPIAAFWTRRQRRTTGQRRCRQAA